MTLYWTLHTGVKTPDVNTLQSPARWCSARDQIIQKLCNNRYRGTFTLLGYVSKDPGTPLKDEDVIMDNETVVVRRTPLHAQTTWCKKCHRAGHPTQSCVH